VATVNNRFASVPMNMAKGPTKSDGWQKTSLNMMAFFVKPLGNRRKGLNGLVCICHCIYAMQDCQWERSHERGQNCQEEDIFPFVQRK
jgi:hypothetical protein